MTNTELKPAVEVVPFGAALGAEIRGVDLRHAGEPGLRSAIRDALLQHHVVAFRDQQLTDAEHLAFAATLGEVYIHPMDRLMGHTEPSMGQLDTTKDHATKTDTWHLDVTYAPNPPAFGILRCVVAPPAGGDTMWANLHLALENLSAPFRERLIGLFTSHDVPDVLMQLKAPMHGPDAIEIWSKNLRDVHQPIVRTHPETGRDALFCVSTSNPIVGMSPEESASILGVLERLATNPNYTCRWRWNVGDVVVWDERCTAHFAVRDPWEGPRSMRRVLVEGDVSIPATA